MLTIKDGPCQVLIAPERGALVASLKVQNQELLYLDQATFDDPTKNVRGGIPVLFPLCGPLPKPSYTWAESLYFMKQHGFARNLSWSVVEHSQDRLTLELTDNELTRAQYPFKFCYRLVYQARPDGLHIGQSIRNLSEISMPLQFGFHPYFLVGQKDRLEFFLPVSRYSDNKSPTQGDFSRFDFSAEEIDWAFPRPTGSSASFIDPSRGLTLKITYSAHYGVLVFWTLKGCPFVCLEPWSSSRLAFPEGPDLHRLGAGETLEAEVSVSVELKG